MSKAMNVKPNDAPTMEEILSSIRSIIEEDNDSQPSKGEDSRAMSNNQNTIDSMFDTMDMPQEQPKPEAKPAQAAAPADVDDIMELTEVVEEAAPTAAAPSELEMIAEPVVQQQPQVDLPEVESAPADIEIEMDAMPSVPQPLPQETVQSKPAEPKSILKSSGPQGLDSGLTSEVSVDASARSLLEISDLVGGVSSMPMGGAKTLEQLTKELLEPHLKAWLDDNLPHITENLVRQEINRLVSRLEKRK